MDYVSIDPTGKIYLPSLIRKKIDVKSKYLVIVLPDGDVILHQISRSRDPLRDFQKIWSSEKGPDKIRKTILEEAIKQADISGD